MLHLRGLWRPLPNRCKTRFTSAHIGKPRRRLKEPAGKEVSKGPQKVPVNRPPVLGAILKSVKF